MASFIDHKIIWIYEVQYGYSKKMMIFSELLKMDLGPFRNKLFKCSCHFFDGGEGDNH